MKHQHATRAGHETFFFNIETKADIRLVEKNITTVKKNAVKMWNKTIETAKNKPKF